MSLGGDYIYLEEQGSIGMSQEQAAISIKKSFETQKHLSGPSSFFSYYYRTSRFSINRRVLVPSVGLSYRGKSKFHAIYCIVISRPRYPI